jgi:hypothetical protein
LKRLLIIIAMVLIAADSFAADSEKHFAFIAGGEFQTQDGFGNFPFMGFSAGLAGRAYANLSGHDLWIRVMYQKTWPLNISNAAVSGELERSTLSVGAQFVLESCGFHLGLEPGLLHRVTGTGDSFSTAYGFYLEGSALVTGDPRTSMFVFQPSVILKYMFNHGLEVGLGITVPVRFF